MQFKPLFFKDQLQLVTKYRLQTIWFYSITSIQLGPDTWEFFGFWLFSVSIFSSQHMHLECVMWKTFLFHSPQKSINWVSCTLSTLKTQEIVVLLPQWKFSSVQSLRGVELLATPWTVACQACLSITNPRSSPKLLSIEPVMPSSHFILSLSHNGKERTNQGKAVQWRVVPSGDESLNATEAHYNHPSVNCPECPSDLRLKNVSSAHLLGQQLNCVFAIWPKPSCFLLLSHLSCKLSAAWFSTSTSNLHFIMGSGD